MKIGKKFLIKLLSTNAAFSYVADRYVEIILQALWRQQGINLGKGIKWAGFPIITLADLSNISIGNNCFICSRSVHTALGVNHPVILRTLYTGAELIIGTDVRMSGTSICAAERVIIGDRCVIGSNVTITDTDFHSFQPNIRTSPEDLNFAQHKPVEIGCDVFIGSGSFILKGVRIGNESIIGAGSIVTNDVSDGEIVAGNPARSVGRIV